MFSFGFFNSNIFDKFLFADIKRYFVESGSVDVAIEKLEDIKDESN